MIERPNEGATFQNQFGKRRWWSKNDVNFAGPTLEPPLPRRKKCPELAYRSHEFITAADGGGIDAIDSNVVADKVRVRITLLIIIFYNFLQLITFA